MLQARAILQVLHSCWLLAEQALHAGLAACGGRRCGAQAVGPQLTGARTVLQQQRLVVAGTKQMVQQGT